MNQEAEKCEKHRGLPVKVRKAKIAREADGCPSVIDVLMDNGRVAQYRYLMEIDSSVWEEEKES